MALCLEAGRSEFQGTGNPFSHPGTILLKIFQVPEKFLCDSEMAGYRAVEWQSVLLVWCVGTFARAQSKFCHRHFFF